MVIHMCFSGTDANECFPKVREYKKLELKAAVEKFQKEMEVLAKQEGEAQINLYLSRGKEKGNNPTWLSRKRGNCWKQDTIANNRQVVQQHMSVSSIYLMNTIGKHYIQAQTQFSSTLIKGSPQRTT